jgi:hypothetical protein
VLKGDISFRFGVVECSVSHLVEDERSRTSIRPLVDETLMIHVRPQRQPQDLHLVILPRQLAHLSLSKRRCTA